MKETVATSASAGPDADDKKKVTEMKDAAETLKRTLSYFYKTFLDHNANTAALHEDIANLYPASEKLSVAVATLNQGGAILHDSPALVEELKNTIERPLDEIAGKCKAAMSKIDRRALARAEIEHYKSKIVKLANDGLQDAKKQEKAETNQSKLATNQKEFRELDEEISSMLAKLDSDIADNTNAAIAAYMQMMANYSSGMLHTFGSAIQAIPGGVNPAPPVPSTSSAVTEGAGAQAEATEAQPMSSFTAAAADVGDASETAAVDAQ